ncbi:VanZ family protein [Paenibacillus caui]|uniref:VanZ family protein n=1 Tax=Paenibacillus caui TaxID=2873927 RepID=UPI001CA7FBD1|nr:VanZ family protein [Paenibacillus caui]
MRNKLSSRNGLLSIAIAVSAVIYAVIMLKLLIFRGRAYGFHAYNLVPFKTINSLLMQKQHYNFTMWYRNLFGNIVLFIPLGIYFPLWKSRFWHTWKLAIAVALLIFAVECIQLLSAVGSFDVDDIILNTFGALLGLALMKGLRLMIRAAGGNEQG